MRKISVCDISVRRSEEFAGTPLPFRIKIEAAKLLSNLGVSAIATTPVLDGKTDYYLVKSLASTITGSCIAVPVDILDAESVGRAWSALKDAAHPRLQVPVPSSTVQMEYFCHKKPAAILELIAARVAECAALCGDVEFVAEDFTRAEKDFLAEAISVASASGATMVTVSDAAGTMLPNVFYDNVKAIREMLPQQIRLGVQCSNELYLSDACAVAAVQAGADEIKTMAFGRSTVSLKRFPKILNVKADECDAQCGIKLTNLDHVIDQVHKLCGVSTSKSHSLVSAPADSGDIRLYANDTMADVLGAVRKLGIELGEEDCRKVYDAFLRIASADGYIGAKELDAIVASVAFQVPAKYHMESFVINTGNILSPTCHIRLKKGGETLESVCVGDGPVDAAFTAIEKVVGRHYELDDFQIRSVTEGREAMGETVVKLRHDGKVYSGRGVSKDIVASSVYAYLNAVNKIVYEEEQA